jgi:pimeloyl-ACP methyl ester carboxylesterase
MIVALAGLLALTTGCAAIPGGTGQAPTGRIDIGGRRLWIDCRGQGSPVVVIESALGAGTSAETNPLADAVAQHTTVCRYDRAGYGNSDPAPHSAKTIGDLVDDLAALLVAAHLQGPYLLVGNELGAQIVLHYALTHEKDVAGLVIVDTDWPTTDVSRGPLAGLLSAADQALYFRGEDLRRAWLAETESIVHPLPNVMLRVLTATQADQECPASWGKVVCDQADVRHILFQADWLVLNPRGVIVKIDAPRDFAGADDILAREIVAGLEAIRSGN